MSSDINFWFILLSAVAGMIVGFFWYGPVFGKAWMKAALNIGPEDKEKIDEMKKKSTVPMVTSIIGWMITAYITSNLFAMFGVTETAVAVQIMFWLWLGLILPARATNALYGDRPKSLIFIDSGYWLVMLVLIGTILTI